MIVIKQFRDKISKALYHEGETYMGSESRMEELVFLGYLESEQEESEQEESEQEEPMKEVSKGKKKKGD